MTNRIMKFTLILLGLLAAQQLRAQVSIPIQIGIEAGANIANANLDPPIADASITKGTRTGLAVGGIGELGLGSDFSLSVEALYQQGGYKLTGPTGEATGKFDYIDFPLSGRYRLGFLGSPLTPYVLAGLNIGMNVNAKYEVDSAGQTQVFDVKDSTASVDFGVHIGLGAEYKVSPNVNVRLDARYQVGLSDFDNTAQEQKVRNFLILLGVTYSIGQ